MDKEERMTIAIIGAGVIGLQNALTLLTESQLKPTPKVFLIADAFPGSLSPLYTSPWAGGQWRSHAHPTSASGIEQCDWDLQTYKYWKQLVSSEHPKGLEDARQIKVHKSSGVGMLKCRQLWDQVADEIRPVHGKEVLGGGLWWADKVDDFRVLRDYERPPGTIFGVEWTGFCMDVPQYLKFLVEQLKENGATLVEAKLPTDGGLPEALLAAEKLVGHVDWFVNATGLRAKDLCHDDKVFPTRGQTVLVRGEANMARTRMGDGYIAYTIPRPGSGTTVLGGVNEPGSWNEKIDEVLHDRIIERAKILAPELIRADGTLDIIGDQVGFRPTRGGGARVEIEEVAKRRVIHCYGHGGAGYQNSVGSSMKVAELLREYETKHPRHLQSDI